MQTVLRFLELVRRDLGADDARLELGGRTPDDSAANALPDRASSTLVWAPLSLGASARVVALWESALPSESVALKGARLRTLVETFGGAAAREALTTVRPGSLPGPHARFVLDDALDVLAQRARAERALVIDHASPEVWGSSEVPRAEATVDDAVWLARVYDDARALGLSLAELVTLDDAALRALLVSRGVDPAQVAHLSREVDYVRTQGPAAVEPGRLRVVRALAKARALEHAGAHAGAMSPASEASAHAAEASQPSEPAADDVHILVRPFANIYRLVLVFDGAFSELHAEAALIRALPVIERMVLSLPPRNPEGAAGAGKVRVLRRLRRV